MATKKTATKKRVTRRVPPPAMVKKIQTEVRVEFSIPNWEDCVLRTLPGDDEPYLKIGCQDYRLSKWMEEGFVEAKLDEYYNVEYTAPYRQAYDTDEDYADRVKSAKAEIRRHRMIRARYEKELPAFFKWAKTVALPR